MKSPQIKPSKYLWLRIVTKTTIVEKTPEKQCEVNAKGQQLTQVKQYKYLGATVENTGQCKTEVAKRIIQA